MAIIQLFLSGGFKALFATLSARLFGAKKDQETTRLENEVTAQKHAEEAFAAAPHDKQHVLDAYRMHNDHLN